VKWLRRFLFVGAVVSLLGTWAVTVRVNDAKAEHPRDTYGFIVHLGRGDRDLYDPADNAFLIAEGDQGCDWLREQPYPLWRRGVRYSFGVLLDRYGREHPASRERWTDAGFDPLYRQVVVSRAWIDLCGDARKLHARLALPSRRNEED
jgi:hypothetical protein